MRRIVIEDVCPIHKKAKPHFLWGIKGIPRCPVGSRTVLSDRSEALRVLFPDGPTDTMVAKFKARIIRMGGNLASDTIEAGLRAALGVGGTE